MRCKLSDRSAASQSAGTQSSHLLWRLRNGGTPQRQPPVQALYIGAADLDSAYSSRGSAGAASAAPAIVSRYSIAASDNWPTALFASAAQ
jgi:hypothetical protein